MKLIGLDVGTKRIGVAKADTSVKIAVPQCTITVDGTEFSQLSRLSRVHDTKFFVIGLPRNNSGEETAQSKYSRAFAEKLKKSIPGARVAFQDESLTSVEAEENLKKRKKSFEKGDIDAEAASIILQDFLENFHNGAIESESFKSTGVMPKPKQKFKLNPKIRIAIIVALVVLTLGAGGAYLFYSLSLNPIYSVECNENEETLNPDACAEKTVVIAEGSTLSDIATTLKNRMIIKNDLAFKIYAKLSGNSSSLKAGTYTLRPNLSVEDIVAIMTDGSAGVVKHTITTYPGGTLSDFIATLKLAGFSEDEIRTALGREYLNPVLSSKPADASLEGYIYGETITYTDKDTVEDIIGMLLEELSKSSLSYSLESRFHAHGLSFHEGVTLASIVQKEANNPEDMAMVAGVFYNRLALGMSLGSDVTVQYALDQVDPDRKTYQDNISALDVDSCYNTRKNPGLPCGPISNPGISALRAVATPTDSPYLFFLTGDDGKMYYSTTEAEHNANIIEHCQKLCGLSL